MKAKFLFAILLLFCFPSAVMAQTVSGKIEKIWVDHDTYNNGEKGMMIHVKFSVDNMRNKQGSCNAWFFFSDGTRLKDFNSRYSTKSGYVATFDNYMPKYESSIYSDFKLFMPISELHLSAGEHELKFYVGIIDNNGNEIADSDWYYFRYTDSSGGHTPKPAPTPTPAPTKHAGSRSSAKTVYNPDGSYTITTTLDCPNCFATGQSRCISCNGSGKKAIYGYPIYYITCPMCSGAGQVSCPICLGVGCSVLTRTYWPNADPPPPVGPSGGGAIVNPVSPIGGGSGTASGSSVCKGCRGSGKCGMCYGSGYRTCGACNGAGITSSGSCGGCNGAGKNICSGCRGSGNCGTCYGSGKINY